MTPDADEITAAFYYHLYKWDGIGKPNHQTAIHKLNFQILFNESANAQDWVDAMVSFALKKVTNDQQSKPIVDNNHETFEIIDVLRNHYNSLVPENKKLNAQLFEATLGKQQSKPIAENQASSL